MNRYSYIKSLMVRKRITAQQLADELNLSRPAVSGPLNGLWRSRRVEEHVAKRLGRTYEKLWGKHA
jgi:transcriptional regulator with XRE-family HTH domain